jgi:hypothetical protein
MTGRIGFKSSCGEALQYCLNDKQERQEKSQKVTEPDGRQVKNRAEVLHYHQCFGDEKELVRQFKEAQKQDLNISKPTFHLSLSLPPQDKIPKSRFVDIAQECAKALDFEDHQYVVIQHKDTQNPHIHLVVNRVGFDGHVMEDKYVLERVNKFCREVEQRYELTPVKDIYRQRLPEERLQVRDDPRSKRLHEEIGEALKQVHDLDGFRERLVERGYKVYKNERGIAFVDSDGVKLQGNMAGYPWKEIEAALEQNLAQRERLLQEREEAKRVQQELRAQQELRKEHTRRRGLRMRM